MTTKSLDRKYEKITRLNYELQSTIRKIQNWRLIVSAMFFAGLVVSAAQPDWQLAPLLIAVYIVVFGLLVWRTRRLLSYSERLRLLACFYSRQIMRRRGLQIPERFIVSPLQPPQLKGPERVLALDLGLFGPHSVYSLLDETVSDGGKKHLANWLINPPPSLDEIKRRQTRTTRLARHRWFLLRVLINSQKRASSFSTSEIRNFIEKPLFDRASMRLITLVFGLWAVAGLMTVLAFVKGNPIQAIFGVTYLAVGFWAINRAGDVFKKGIALENHLSVLRPMLRMLETKDKVPEFAELLPKILKDKPTQELRQINLALAGLSIEANPLVFLILNILTPWTLFFAWYLERARAKLSSNFTEYLDEIHEYEAQMSLVFHYIYQTRTFPEFHAEPLLRAQGVYHPLIERGQVIDNDFSFSQGKKLGLITGSNMSGKSTFLRTVGINQILANMGATVYATKFETYPYQVETCIQVADSLREGFSYFFAEALRLKHVLDQVNTEYPVLYLIDEIFRGTNNRERQIGSRAVISSLLKHPSLGFVSTHDLELTELADAQSAIQNFHFTEEIRQNEMVFPYKVFTGPCQSTNALRIMHTLGLPVEEGA